MDELDLAFGILPLSIIVLSIIFTYIFKKVYIMPLVSIVVSVILMFIVFNLSFWGWVVVYGLVSLVLSSITNSIRKKIDNRNK
ncbi:DUF2651 family protein [Bacillus velezensis]|uniref:DUF2651 family protein n=1 Tax=Bacillus velezensis TaxID=492670 RepID=UPI000D0330E6|nr:DUF2651 family protein [Bacillus velezensis]PRS99371.1 hypothetical protein C6354_12925 [Bacillus velezensis]QMI90514.1 DUF2651 family protein [Bacillus velezensis]